MKGNHDYKGNMNIELEKVFESAFAADVKTNIKIWREISKHGCICSRSFQTQRKGREFEF